MSKKDTLTKQYLGQNKVFADAFNYYLFHGRQVIKPEDLKEQDPTEIAMIRKLGQVFPHQMFRDVLKHCLVPWTRSPQSMRILLPGPPAAAVSRSTRAAVLARAP